VQAPELSFLVAFHAENCTVHSWNPTISSAYLFIHHSHTHKQKHRTDKKTDKPDGKPVLCQRTFSSFFRAGFLHSKTAQFNLKCMGPFREVVLEVSQAEPSRDMIHVGVLHILKALKPKHLSIDRFLGAYCEISHNWLRSPVLQSVFISHVCGI